MVLEPIERNPVLDDVFPLCIVGETAVGPWIGAVIGDIRGGTRGDRHRSEILVGFGADLIPEIGGDGLRDCGLLDADDVRTEKFMGPVLAQRTEILDEDAADLIVGMQLADAVGLLIPQSPQDLGRFGVGVGIGVTDHHIFGRHCLREHIAVNGIHRNDPAGGNRDPRAIITLFRPENRPRRGGGRGGNVETLLVENITVAGRLRQAGPPGHLHGSRGAGKYDLGVRAVVVAGKNPCRQRLDLGGVTGAAVLCW